MGYVAKADGRVSESELWATRNIMRRMMLTPETKLSAMRHFTEGKAPNTLEWALDPLASLAVSQPQLIRLLVTLVTEVALSEGSMSARQENIMLNLCERLQFSRYEYYGIRARHEAQYRFAGVQHRSDRGHRGKWHQGNDAGANTERFPESSALDRAYLTLGVGRTSSLIEVKQAYRRKMSVHHPDKLTSQGVSGERLKRMTAAAQEIQMAYDLISKSLSRR